MTKANPWELVTAYVENELCQIDGKEYRRLLSGVSGYLPDGSEMKFWIDSGCSEDEFLSAQSGLRCDLAMEHLAAMEK